MIRSYPKNSSVICLECGQRIPIPTNSLICRGCLMPYIPGVGNRKESERLWCEEMTEIGMTNKHPYHRQKAFREEYNNEY